MFICGSRGFGSCACAAEQGQAEGIPCEWEKKNNHMEFYWATLKIHKEKENLI